MKHTPGPWRVEARTFAIADTGDYDGCWKILSGDGKRPIAEIWDEGEAPEANARLIAAAPELLEALKAMVGSQHAGPITSEMFDAWEKGRAAIAKAEGA